MEAWQFPTSTCEAMRDSFPVQPFSALFGLVTITVLLRQQPRTAMVWSLVAFELVHIYGHAMGATGSWLSTIQHAAAYPILLLSSRHWPPWWLMALDWMVVLDLPY